MCKSTSSPGLGELDPEVIVTPGISVQRVVLAERSMEAAPKHLEPVA